MAKRKAKDDGFNTSVPDLIAQFREIRDCFLNHPAIPRPWPAGVPSPKSLDWKMNELEQAHLEDPKDVPGIKRLNKIRRELKTSMAILLGYVEQILTGSLKLLPPGFDLSRNPGCVTGCDAYGSGLQADLRPQQEGPKANWSMEVPEPRKYLVRAVRPVFQAACIEIEARDREEAIERARSVASQIPEAQWTGKYDSDQYYSDVHSVRTGLTAEGYPFSLLDFPRYTVVSTNPLTPVERYAVRDPWMDEAPPILVASLLSVWTDQMFSSQGVVYDDAIEEFQEILQQWKGSDDQKVLPLKPPEERRFLMEMTEQVLRGIDLLKDTDE